MFGVALTGAIVIGPAQAAPAVNGFSISLAEWSLNRSLSSNVINYLDIPKLARTRLRITALEHVSELWPRAPTDRDFVRELKTRRDGEGVRSLVMMRGHDHILGHADADRRHLAIEDMKPWLDVAAELGCHSLRVFALSTGNTLMERLETTASALHNLCALAKPLGLNILVENHNGNSSQVEWLMAVINRVEADNIGTLPDFGNWNVGDTSFPIMRDRYAGVAGMMPRARAVSAKAFTFDRTGAEMTTDYLRMMRIVAAAGYRGRIGIEYEGDNPDEFAGILATRDLLTSVFARL